MNSLRIKKGDLVKVVAGAHKGKTGKVVTTNLKDRTVTVEGLGVLKRRVKPSQLNPQGGTKEIHRPLDISKVALVVDETKGKISRVGYSVDKDGKKIRTAKALKNKEIK